MIERLMAALKTATGVDFVRDAWMSAPTGDYGVVEVPAEATQLRADDHVTMIMQSVDVYLYTRTDGKTAAGKVETCLDGNENVLRWVLSERAFVEAKPDILVRHRWTLTMLE